MISFRATSLLFSALGALWLWTGCSATKPRPATSPPPLSDAQRGASLERELGQIRDLLRVPGLSAAVARDGEVVWSAGLGYADLEAGVPATPATVYRTGSITKTLTAVLMLQLREEGRLDLDWRVNDHVDWEVPPEIRIRHVLSHTSEKEPGTFFRYSSRFNWLDNVVESASGEPFKEQIVEGILRPAGMESSVPGEDTPGYEAVVARLAKPYQLDENRQPQEADYPPVGFHSSSGLSSTVLDLARFSDALDSGLLLQEESLALAFSPTRSPSGEALPYGLGWFVQRAPGLELVRHGGWWPTFSGLLLKVPDRGLTYAVLLNSDAASAPYQGSENTLISAFTQAFFRSFLHDSVVGRPPAAAPWSAEAADLRPQVERLSSAAGRFYFGHELLSRGVTAAAAAERARADGLLELAVDCCPGALEAFSDPTLAKLLGASASSKVRVVALEAGERRLAADPGDALARFELAVTYGRILEDFRIRGEQGDRAQELLETVIESEEAPDFAPAWSAYLVAERIYLDEPERARRLLQRVVDSGVDTDRLQERTAAVLAKLGGGGGNE